MPQYKIMQEQIFAVAVMKLIVVLVSSLLIGFFIGWIIQNLIEVF